MNEEEIQAAIKELTEELTADAVMYFRKALDKANLVLTGDLIESMDYTVKQEVGMLGATAEIFFREYGRFKDMRRVRYPHYMNVDAIADYVDKVGIEKFAWVNGYENKSSVPTVKNAKARIVASIIFARKKVPVVVQNSKKQWYNRTKMAYFNVMGRRLNSRLSEILPKYMKDILENQT